jgi:hypothetical protein
MTPSFQREPDQPHGDARQPVLHASIHGALMRRRRISSAIAGTHALPDRDATAPALGEPQRTEDARAGHPCIALIEAGSAEYFDKLELG